MYTTIEFLTQKALQGRLLGLLIAVIFVTASATVLMADPVSDEGMEAKIIDRLQREALWEDNNIELTVTDHIVSLNGSVETLAEKRLIRKAINNVDKDLMVQSKLEVTDGKLTDARIANDIKQAIEGNTFYTMYDWVTVDVENGVATLSGYAHEPYLEKSFIHQAEKAPGVKKVVNNIEILPTSIFDDEIRHQAAYAVYQDPSFEPYSYASDVPIHFIVNDGKVWLKGEVKSEIGKVRAENLVMMHTQAMDVENDLRVVRGEGS